MSFCHENLKSFAATMAAPKADLTKPGACNIDAEMAGPIVFAELGLGSVASLEHVVVFRITRKYSCSIHSITTLVM